MIVRELIETWEYAGFVIQRRLLTDDENHSNVFWNIADSRDNTLQEVSDARVAALVKFLGGQQLKMGGN